MTGVTPFRCIWLLTGIALWAAPQGPDPAKFGPGGAFHLEYSQDDFGQRSHGVVEQLAAYSKFSPLPQSDVDAYAALRPNDLALNPLSATAGNYERQETIGPHQVDGDRLWFGKSFYDGEGMRGVGAFGYFDAVTRQYRMFSPREVAPYEVSAILVERDVVWVGLDHFGEDISTFPGGLIEWNKTNNSVIRRYPIEFVVTAISHEGDSLRLTTNGGYALLNNGELHRFRVTDASGRPKTTPIDLFPPPPSHY